LTGGLADPMVTATGICIGSAGEPLLSGLLFLASTPIDLPPIGAIPYSNCRRAAPSLLPTLTRAAGPYLAPLDLLWSASWQIEARNSKLALGVYAHELRHCLSPLADASDFAYACDVAEDNICKPGHVVELSF
jgi:hypothetical protein